MGETKLATAMTKGIPSLLESVVDMRFELSRLNQLSSFRRSHQSHIYTHFNLNLFHPAPYLVY